jgi:hypothetical protein
MNGDAMAFATQLFDENFRLREDKRALNEELTAIKAKVPADDHVVLTPAEAQEYETYKALGKLDEIQTRLDASETTETELTELKQKDVLREVADLHGYKLSILVDRDKAAGGLEVSFKTDSKGNKVAHVKDGDKETPITEFAETNWADYLPSLKVETASQPLVAIRGAKPSPRANGLHTAVTDADKRAAAEARRAYRE